MTPDEQRTYYKITERMNSTELIERANNCKFAYSRWERSIARMEEILANPEATRQEINRLKLRIIEMKEKRAILLIRYKEKK